MSITTIANNRINFYNGNIGIGISKPTTSLDVYGGIVEIKGSITCDSLEISGPFAKLTTATQYEFKSWIQSVTDEAKDSWWSSASKPLLNNRNDIISIQAPFVEYLFGSLGDTGTNATTLTLAGTGVAIAVKNNDTTVGNYLLVDNSTTTGVVSASAGITTTTAELISGGNGTGSGLTMSFDIKWESPIVGAAGSSTGNYLLGFGQNLNATSFGPGSVSAVATGMAIFTDTINKNVYLAYTDVNGKYESHENLFPVPSEFFSTNWQHIDIVINQTTLLSFKLYVNGVFIHTKSIGGVGTSNAVTTSLTFAASSGSRTYLATTGTDAYRVANFRLWKRPLSAGEIANNYNLTSSILRTPDVEYLFASLADTGKNATALTTTVTSGATSAIAVQTGDTQKGNYLLVDNSASTGLVSASAAIATSSTAELISSTTLTTGSGLTMSFDFKWITCGTGVDYYIVGLGKGANNMPGYVTDTASATATAYGIAISKLDTSSTSPITALLYISSTGTYQSVFRTGTTLFSLNSWNHIDVVIHPTTLTPVVYLNGVIFSLPSNENTTVTTTSFYLAASSLTRTHFAVEDTDAYRVANFRLWKRALSAAEISSNYSSSPSLSYNPIIPAYKGSTLLQDGRVLFIPNNSTTMYIYTPSTKTYTTGLSSTGYNGGVLLPDGRVVLVPETATTIALYNPYGNTVTTTLSATQYAGGVFLPNGSVLFVPSNAATIGLYTPYATTPSITPGASLPVINSELASKYSGAVLLADGRVFLVPNAATCPQLYDYVTDSFDTTVSALSATGYSGGVLLTDGRVVLIPKTATTIKIFDPTNNTLIDPVASTGYSGGILLPDGRVMLVPNTTSDIAYFNSIDSSLTVIGIGALDSLGIYSTAVGCYAFKRLFKEYTGAQIRLRRSETESIDVWFSNTGAIVKYQPIVSGVTGSVVITNSITSWINSASPIYISTWYDQSSGAKHLTQATTSTQPQFEYDKLLGGYGVRFTGTENMSAANLFATTTVTNMHLITKVRETIGTDNHGISFNGADDTNPTRFLLAIPWNSERIWYWDSGNWPGNRVQSAAGITIVNAVAQVSAYKLSTGTVNGLTVNNITYSTATSVVGTVSGGLIIGGFTGRFYNGFFQYFITLSAKTTDANTQSVFNILKDNTNYNNYNGGTLTPEGSIVLAHEGANNVGIVSGFPSVSVERCLHPCFNKF